MHAFPDSVSTELNCRIPSWSLGIAWIYVETAHNLLPAPTRPSPTPPPPLELVTRILYTTYKVHNAISINASWYCCYGGYFLSVILQKPPNFLELQVLISFGYCQNQEK